MTDGHSLRFANCTGAQSARYRAERVGYGIALNAAYPAEPLAARFERLLAQLEASEARRRQ